MTFRQFAFRNSWRNKGTYAAFLFASIVSIFVFFTFAMLLAHPNLEEGYLSRIGSLGLRAATIVVFGFSGLFVLYSLGAFLQARKKEFGLLVMHGMRRNQLRKMIFLENLLMGLGALVIGLIIGLCFMKWFLLIGEAMLNIEHLQFYFPIFAIVLATIVYGALFLVISLCTTFFIRTNNVQELMHGVTKPKPFPKTSWMLALVGGLALVYGYYRSATTTAQDIGNDLLIVAPLIMGGTYFLFTQASIWLLKKLQSMKSLNWRRTRLIVLSNLVFKVKDNSRIFFLVAIVTTGAICAVGAIASLSTVAEEEVENQPFAFTYVTGNIYEVLDSIGISRMRDDRRDADIAMLQNNLEQEGLEYTFYSMPIKGVKSSISDEPVALFSNQNYNEAMEVIGGESVYLQGKEAILIPPLVGLLAGFNELRMGEQLQLEGSVENWTVVDVVKPLVPNNLLGKNLIVLPNESYDQIEARLDLQFDGFYVPEWRQVEGLDNNLRSEKRLYANVADRYAERMELYSTMIFIAVLTGIVFFLTAGSFLYFRLYTDLSTDKKRFDVLGKLGLKEKELKRIVSIETGVLFFMPFVVAGIHSIFAFWALQSMYSLSIHRSMTMVLIIFTIAQLLYYWLMKRHYMSRLLSMIGE